MALSFSKPRSFEQVQKLFEQLNRVITAAGLLWRYAGSGATEIVWNVGSQAIPWPGGSVDSTATPISHGLGATPDVVIAVANSHDYNPGVFTFGATQFTFRCRSVSGATPAAGNSGTIFWLAIAVT